MALSPEQLTKLTQQIAKDNAARLSDGGQDNEMTAGEKSAFLAKIERMFQRHIHGQGRAEGGIAEQIRNEIKQKVGENTEKIESLFSHIKGNVSGKISEVVLSDDRESEESFIELMKASFKDDDVSKVVNKNQRNAFTSFFQSNVFAKIWGRLSNDAFVGKIIDVSKSIKTLIKGSFIKLGKSWNWLKNNFTSLGKFIRGSISKVFKGLSFIKNMFSTAFAFIFTAFRSTMKVSGAILRTVGSVAFRVITFIISSIVPMLFSVLTFLGTILVKSLIHLGLFLAWMVQVGVALFVPVAIILTKVLLVSAIVILALLAIWLVYNFIRDWINLGFTDAVKNVFKHFEFFWSEIKNMAIDALEGLESILGLPPGTFMKYFDKAFDWFKSIFNWFEKIWSNLVQPVVDYLNFVYDFWNEKFDKIGDIVSGIGGTVGNWFETAFNWWSDRISELKDWWEVNITLPIANFLVDVYNFLVGIFNTIIKAINTIGNFRFTLPVPDWMNGPWNIGPLMSSPIDLVEELSYVSIEELALGGIITNDTIALIGEGASNEAVIPLNEQGMEFLAKSLRESQVFGAITNQNNTSGSIVIESVGSVIMNNVRESMTAMNNRNADNVFIDAEQGVSNLRTINNNTSSSLKDIEDATDKLQVEITQTRTNHNKELVQLSGQISEVQKSIMTNGRQIVSGDRTNSMDNFVDLIAKGIIEGR